MVVSTAALIEGNDNPTDEEIAEALSGNLCRCTGYAKTIEAVREAARRVREEDAGMPSRRRSRSDTDA
jgi:aerobic-type carbon monoxide dehydrogenase small subunit (CoxS/CutS family)